MNSAILRLQQETVILELCTLNVCDVFKINDASLRCCLDWDMIGTSKYMGQYAKQHDVEQDTSNATDLIPMEVKCLLSQN